MMLATFTSSPNLVITEEESKKLAAGITRVVELYDVPMLDERSRAWIGLALVGVEVYGTRITAAVVAAKRRPAVVTPFRHPQPQQQPPQQQPPPVTINQPFTEAHV
jgi:hypothetical protein